MEKVNRFVDYKISVILAGFFFGDFLLHTMVSQKISSNNQGHKRESLDVTDSFN